MAGASENEIALVLFLLMLVVIAPKVGKIGEAIGGWLGGRAAAREAPDGGGGARGEGDAGEGPGPEG